MAHLALTIGHLAARARWHGRCNEVALNPMATTKEMAMNDTARAYDLDLDLDDISGIRSRVDVASFIDCGQSDEPTPVYFELMGRRFFLGVRFERDVIVADDWDVDMLAAGVPECMIASTFSWLAQRSI